MEYECDCCGVEFGLKFFARVCIRTVLSVAAQRIARVLAAFYGRLGQRSRGPGHVSNARNCLAIHNNSAVSCRWCVTCLETDLFDVRGGVGPVGGSGGWGWGRSEKGSGWK